MATAAKMPMIATTIINSIRVKPDSRLAVNLFMGYSFSLVGSSPQV